MLVEETTIDEDEEARQAYKFEHNMNIKNGIYDTVPSLKEWDKNMNQIVAVIHKISNMYGIAVPRYYFLKSMGNARGTATPGTGIMQKDAKVCLDVTATVFTAIHEMAHIVCFHLREKFCPRPLIMCRLGHGHGSLFIGILTYLYQRLGHWTNDIQNIPLFACKLGEDGELVDRLEYDFEKLHDAEYLPKDEYTYEVNVRMFLQRGNYQKVLAKIDKKDIVEYCNNWYITGQGKKFTKEEKQCIREKMEDMFLCMEDNTLEGIAEFASNCYEFSEERFKEDRMQHVVDCYIDGITDTIFDFISYNGIELYSDDFETEEWDRNL